jgi:endonuclease/exonuclease/phosphatase family metal-dependent hydrolase
MFRSCLYDSIDSSDGRYTPNVNNDPYEPNYTYTTKETMLDYILFNQSVISQLRSYEILSEGSISSTSDHLPIVVKIKLDYNPHRLSYSYMKSPAWQKKLSINKLS